MRRRIFKVYPPRVEKKILPNEPVRVISDDYNKMVTKTIMYSDRDATQDIGVQLAAQVVTVGTATPDFIKDVDHLLVQDVETTKSHLPLGVKNLLSGDPFSVPVNHASILSMKNPSVVGLRSALAYNYALLSSRIDIALNHHKVRMEKGGVADTAVLQDLPTPLDYSQSIPDGSVSRRMIPRRDSLMPILLPMDAPSDVLETLKSMIASLVNHRLLALGLNEEGGAEIEKIPISKSGEELLRFDVKGSAGNFVVHFLPVSFSDNQSATSSVYDLTKLGHTGFGFNWYESSLDSFRRGKDDRSISGESKDAGMWPAFFDKKSEVIVDEAEMVVDYTPFVTAKINGHAIKKLVDNAMFNGVCGPFYSSYYPGDALVLGILLDRLAQAGEAFFIAAADKYPATIIDSGGHEIPNPVYVKASAYSRSQLLQTATLFKGYMDAENFAIDIAGRIAYPNGIDPSCVSCSEIPFFERIMNTVFVLRSVEYAQPVRDIVALVSGADLRNGNKTGNIGPLTFGNKASADLHSKFQPHRRLAYDLLTTHVFYCVL